MLLGTLEVHSIITPGLHVASLGRHVEGRLPVHCAAVLRA